MSNKLIGAKSRLYMFMLLTNNLKKHSTAITQVFFHPFEQKPTTATLRQVSS